MRIFDTFERGKRPLEVLDPGRVRIYCCGPTPYDMSHIGHARAAIMPDLLVRLLRLSMTVKYVRNITDVDDKIIQRANENEEPPTDLSARFTDEYAKDIGDLNCLEPDVQPKVSEHIAEIVEHVKILIDNGHAYEVDGDVYYRVHKFEPYGKLKGVNVEDLRCGARVQVDDRKESPIDFALWKSAKPGEPSWPSPWGEGRPGWHIECSVMSAKHLGETFDVHAGGLDLIFPHHENEIAQSQGAYGEGTFARYWMHNGMVRIGGEKMSKSLKNFFTIREVTAIHHPEVMRFYLITAHYRSPINFDVEEVDGEVRFPGLDQADERVASMYETLTKVAELVGDAEVPDGDVGDAVEKMLPEFLEAMHDDLCTPAAIGALSPALREVNGLLASAKGVDKKKRRRTLARFLADMKTVASVLGVWERDPQAYLQERRDLKAKRIGLDVAKVEELVKARGDARDAKDWGRADEIRAELDALGVGVRDIRGGGSSWTL